MYRASLHNNTFALLHESALIRLRSYCLLSVPVPDSHQPIQFENLLFEGTNQFLLLCIFCNLAQKYEAQRIMSAI